jgi:hypothetical protein
MPTWCGIVAPIASVSSSKPLTAKPDAVNGFDLAGKVAAKTAKAELRIVQGVSGAFGQQTPHGQHGPRSL